MAPPYLNGNISHQSSPPKHGNATSVKKINKQTSHRGKGRPSKYSKGWIKKLVLLRSCGLTNHQVLQIFGAEGNVNDAANERTVQDYVKRVLGEPDERYGGPSKHAARKHAKFLERLMRLSNEESIRRSKPSGRGSVSTQSVSLPEADVLEGHEPSNPGRSMSVDCNDHKSSGKFERLNLAYNQMSGKIRVSVSSSLLRAIDRFSRSTWGSASSASTFGLDNFKAQASYAKIMADYGNTHSAAKEALDQKCCGKYYPDPVTGKISDQPLCLHLRILLLMQAMEAHPEDVPMHWEDIQASLEHQVLSQTPLDVHGNSELFFATRVGAPLRVILLLIEKTVDIGSVNAAGRNFLFYLNHLSLNDFSQNCTSATLRSSFHRIVHALESSNFDFEHLDHHGQSFLHCLLINDDSYKTWLHALPSIDDVWRERLARLAGVCNSSGTSLLSIMEKMWGPLDIPNPNNDLGGKSLKSYLQTDFLSTGAFEKLPFEPHVIVPAINSYDQSGRTPTMYFLQEAISLNLRSRFICAKLKVLIDSGANVNARSRGGSTLLHFAAGKARAGVVEYLLTKNVQREYRDIMGRTAYDYAWHLF